MLGLATAKERFSQQREDSARVTVGHAQTSAAAAVIGVPPDRSHANPLLSAFQCIECLPCSRNKSPPARDSSNYISELVPDR
jgi:hypothetical protein